MEWIALAMVVAFLAVIKRPIVYILVFVEFFPRLVASIVAAVFYSSSTAGARLYEFKYYSNYNFYLSLSLLVLLAIVLFVFYLHSEALNKQINTYRPIIAKEGMGEKYAPVILIAIFSFFLFEASSVFGSIGYDITISKNNYVDYVRHPAVYRVMHAIFPAFLVLSAIYIIRAVGNGNKIPRLFVVQIVIAFLLMTILYILLQQKSFIFRTTLLYFGAPLLIYFSGKYNVNKLAGVILSVCAIGFYFATAYQYRAAATDSNVLELVGARLLLEGQLNFINLEQAMSGRTLDFFEYYGFFVDSEAAIRHSVDAYGRDDLVSRAEIGQWLPSGLMPGFIFQTNIWPIFFLIWLGVLLVNGKVLLSAYRFILNGAVVPGFFGIKLTFVLFQFVAQGTNLLSYLPFWVYLIAFLGSAYLFQLKSGSKWKGASGRSVRRARGRRPAKAAIRRPLGAR